MNKLNSRHNSLIKSTKASWFLHGGIKSVITISLVLIILISPLQVMAAAGIEATDVSTGYTTSDGVLITYEADSAKGTFTITVTGTEKDVHVSLVHENVSYGYHLVSNKSETIPLNMGNGEYQLSVLLYISPTKGVPIWNTAFQVEMDKPMAPWLNPSRMVDWTPDMELVEIAASLTVPGDEKATAKDIGNYIGKNYTYNSAIKSLPSTYLPDLKLVMQEKTGICYDFAALYAAMCRSVGIPCRLVMGYTSYVPNVYHAWCEVYVGGEWLTIDPTYNVAEKEGFFLENTQSTVLKCY